MGEFDFTPEEKRYIEASEVYTRFSTAKFSSLTVATIVTALNAITPSPENAPLIKWLIFLIRALNQDANGKIKVTDTKNIGYQVNARTIPAEITTAAPVTLAAAGEIYDIIIMQPPTATLTITGAAAITIPAPGVALIYRFTVYGQVTAQAGVTSCWLLKTSVAQVAST